MQGVVGALLHFTANLLENLPVCTLFIRLFIVLRTVFFYFCAHAFITVLGLSSLCNVIRSLGRKGV